MELAAHVSEEEQGLYRKHAELIVKNTAEKYCCWDPEQDSIVRQCKVDYHSSGEKQTDLIYADYFLLEAVLRLLEKDFIIW